MSATSRRKSLVVALGWLIAGTAPGAASAGEASVTETAPARSPDAARGRLLYNKVGCWQCHGYEGQGGPAVGPPVAGKPYPLEAFSAALRTPYDVMPPYTPRVLSDEGVADILAFLKNARTTRRR